MRDLKAVLAKEAMPTASEMETVQEPDALQQKRQRRAELLNAYGCVCPDCGAAIVFESGCQKCSDPECGWARC